MAEVVRSIKRPTIREKFAKLEQQLKLGIQTLPTEGKVPLKWKPMWRFLGKEFKGTGIGIMAIMVWFIGLLFVSMMVIFIAMFAAGNQNLPLVIRALIPTVFICGLMALMIYQGRLYETIKASDKKYNGNLSLLGVMFAVLILIIVFAAIFNGILP